MQEAAMDVTAELRGTNIVEGPDVPEGVEERLVAEASGERLDVFLARRLGITRSFAQRLVREGRARCEGRKLKPSSRVAEGTPEAWSSIR